MLFSGSLRSNLDPFDESTDEQIWQALESSRLKQYFQVVPDGLSFVVTEGGSNLRFGLLLYCSYCTVAQFCMPVILFQCRTTPISLFGPGIITEIQNIDNGRSYRRNRLRNGQICAGMVE